MWIRCGGEHSHSNNCYCRCEQYFQPYGYKESFELSESFQIDQKRQAHAYASFTILSLTWHDIEYKSELHLTAESKILATHWASQIFTLNIQLCTAKATFPTHHTPHTSLAQDSTSLRPFTNPSKWHQQLYVKKNPPYTSIFCKQEEEEEEGTMAKWRRETGREE